MKAQFILILIFIPIIISCQQKQKDPFVVHVKDKKAYAEIKKKNLDSIYTALLDPDNTRDTEYEQVITAWSTFHKKLSSYIKEADFKWEVPDSVITIYNKIYFDKDGKVEYYLFKIGNPSISEKKRIEFNALLQKFSKEVSMDIKRSQGYAQCGHTKYLNNEN